MTVTGNEVSIYSAPPDNTIHSPVGQSVIRSTVGELSIQSQVGSVALHSADRAVPLRTEVGSASLASVVGTTSTGPFLHRGPWASGVTYAANDLVTALGSLWRCVTSHTSSGDHIDVSMFAMMSGFAPPAVGSLALVGHSYVDTGPLTEGTTGRGYFAASMMRALGLGPHQVTNLAVSGSTARWNANLTLQGLNPGASAARALLAQTGVGVVWYGGNDSIQGYTDDAWQEWTFKRGYHSIISRLRCGAFFENDHASISYAGGTWTAADYLDTWNVNQGSGSSYRKSTTAGDSFTITTHNTLGVHKDGVWIQLLFLGAKSGAAASVSLDGVALDPLDAGKGSAYGTAFGESSDTYLTPYTYRFWLPTTHTDDAHNYAETHEITVEITGAVNTLGLIFDGWGVEADDPPPVLCLSTVSPSNARSIWANLANPVVVAKYNEWTQEVIAEFTDSTGAAQDEAVRYVDVNYTIGGYTSEWSQFSNEKYFTGDGLHPNQIGGQLIAEAVLGELNAAMHLGLEPRRLLSRSTFERDPMWETPRVLESELGYPLTIVDDFERNSSDTAIGGSGWTAISGTWGVDRSGQAALIDSCWLAPWDFRDDFERPDSTTIGDVSFARAGAAPTWVEGKGGWAVNDEALEFTSTSGGSGTYPHAVFDVGSTTHWVEAHMTDVTGNADVGVIVRYVDGSNFIFYTYNGFGVGVLYKVVAGTATSVATGAAYSNPHVEVDGSHVVRVYNGKGSAASITYTITDAALQAGTATKVGVWANTTTGVSYNQVKAGLTIATTGATGAGRNWLLRTVDSVDGVTGITVGDDGTGIPSVYGFVWRYVDSSNYMRCWYDPDVFLAWVVQKIVAGSAVDTWVYWTNAVPGDAIAVSNVGTDVTFYKNGSAFAEFTSGLTTEVETGAALAGTSAGLAFPFEDADPTPRWVSFSWGYEMIETVVRGDLLVDRSDPYTVSLFGFYDQLGSGWAAGAPISPTSFVAEHTYRAISSADGIDDTDGVVGVTGTTTVTLPSVATREGRRFVVKNIGVATVTVDGDGSDTIDGAASVTLAAGVAATFVATDTEWIVI